MTTVSLSTEAEQAVEEIRRARNLASDGEALEEAIGTQQVIASALSQGSRIIIRDRAGNMTELIFEHR